MKAITLHQPWASLIAFLLKPIETRTHDRFRGLVGQTIAIHAGLRVWPGWPNGQYPPSVRHCGYEQLDEATIHAGTHLGCVVCLVDVQAYRRLTDADSAAALCPADGLYGADLVNARRFREPIRATGRQGIWTWEPPENWEKLVI